MKTLVPYNAAVNANRLFLMICGLILLAFALYVSAPGLRALLSPRPQSAETPAMSFGATTAPDSASAPAAVKPALASSELRSFTRLPILFGILPESPAGIRITSFPLIAGQELSASNTEFTFIKVESDDPVSVEIGDCKSDKTKYQSCSNVALNQPIIVHDLRSNEGADSSLRNFIKITAIKP